MKLFDIKDIREMYQNNLTKLRNLNLSENQRYEIIERLRQVSPDLVKGIKSENVSMETLNSNLIKYNKLQANRIVLANLEAEEQKLIAKESARRAKIETALYKNNEAGLVKAVGLTREQLFSKESTDNFFSQTRISRQKYIQVFDSFLGAVNQENAALAEEIFQKNKNIFVPTFTVDNARTVIRQLKKINAL
jgi:hypothetical protein